VLADILPTRLLKALEIQSLCVCILVGCTNQKHPYLFLYHLKLLDEADLVESRREHSFQIYDLKEFEACS